MRSGLAVVKLPKSCEKPVFLSTGIKYLLNTVHNFFGLFAVFTSFMQSFIHGLFKAFQSVFAGVFRALHSTNNNNKFIISNIAIIEGGSL